MEKEYDVIIIGSGVSGALIASELSSRKRRVLILEAGQEPKARVEMVGNYLSSLDRSLHSPYRFVPGVADMAQSPDTPNDYYIQPAGPMAFKSTYERLVGGTTWHWLGNCPRLLPSDFEISKRYGVGRDWPINYNDLEPWYCKAETELGVSGDHKALNNLFGAHRSAGFPMEKIWPSFSDLEVENALKESGLQIAGFNSHPLEITSTPQARNSTPYNGRPACTGNSICVPICPVGAKYDATIHVEKARKNKAELRAKSIVTKIEIDKDSGLVKKIRYQDWKRKEFTVSAKMYVLAANAIESPRLLLLSDIANSSKQVGRNLMDHPQGEGLCDTSKPMFPFRGPPTTSGIEKFRDGEFRGDFCAFRLSLGNDGGGRTKAPAKTLAELSKTMFGKPLVNKLRETVEHEFRLSFLSEMLPSPDNRVTLAEDDLDHLQLPKPKIDFKLDEYTQKGFKKVAEVMREILSVVANSPESIKVPDENTAYLPAGHIMGTCRMGNSPGDSVVDKNCRSHDVRNLFITGSSVFPSGGTANPTLTIAALSLRAADFINKELDK